MSYKERIRKLKTEIEFFECLQLKKEREFQKIQKQFQQELMQIEQAILTRKGGIIELEKIGEEDDPDIT